MRCTQELDKARRTVEDLEVQLKAERSRLRTFATEQTQAERQKDEVALQLRRTESVSVVPLDVKARDSILSQDMAEIREELLRIKNENHELEAELRGTALNSSYLKVQADFCHMWCHYLY